MHRIIGRRGERGPDSKSCATLKSVKVSQCIGCVMSGSSDTKPSHFAIRERASSSVFMPTFGAHERWMSWKDGCADRTVRSPLIGSLKNFTYLYFLLDSSKQFTLSKLRKGRHIFCCFPSCRDCVPSCVACSGITDIGDELFHRRCTKEKKLTSLKKKKF